MSNMFGEFLPNATIQKIMMENDGDQRMKVAVDIAISYDYMANNIGQWFNNNDFKKYVKIKIIQSTDEELTRRINTRNRESKHLLGGRGLLQEFGGALKSGPLNNVMDRHVMTIDDVVGSGESAESYSMMDSDGNITNQITFNKMFYLENNKPSHLSYFAFTYLDAEAINEDHGTELELSENSLFGSVFAETAIKRGRIVGKSHLFITPDGKPWPGAVHQMPSGQWMTGDNPDHEPGTEMLLEKRMVSNNKIHDFRQFTKIKRLEVDLSVFEKNILPSQNKFRFLKNDNMNPTRKPVYFSEAHFTTDRLNRPAFAFSVDYDKMVRETSVFGRLYETRMSPGKNIKSLSIKRRRIKNNHNHNKLGTRLDSGTQFKDTPVETIFTTKDTPDGLSTVEGDNGGISELELYARNSDGIRLFNVYDLSSSSISDGTYQYGVEIKIEDQTVNFLKEQLIELSKQKNKLFNYYVESTKVGMSRSVVRIDDPHIDHFWEREQAKIATTGNYDPISNRFTQEFVLKYADQLLGQPNQNSAPWARPIYSYFNLLSIITDFDNLSDKKAISKGMLTMVAPNTGNPQGVLAVLGMMDDLISKIRDLIGDKSEGINSADKSHTSTSKLPVKTTTIEHWFTNEEFNPNTARNYGYDYLSTSVGALSNRGLRVINGSEYINRVVKEHNRYGAPAEAARVSGAFSDSEALKEERRLREKREREITAQIAELESQGDFSRTPELIAELQRLEASATRPTEPAGQGILDSNSSWSYLSPAFAFLGSDSQSSVFDFYDARDEGMFSMLDADITRFNTTDIPVQKGIYKPVESQSNTTLDDYDMELKRTLTDLYAGLNLTINPTLDNSDDNLNPNELLLSLLKTTSKTGAANHEFIDNQYTEYGKVYKFDKVAGKKQDKLDTREIDMSFYQGGVEELLTSTIPTRVAFGGSILSSCGIPPDHPQLNGLGYKFISDMRAAAIKNLPLQVRVLMNSKGSTSEYNLQDPKQISYFNFNHSMINRVDVLTGFSTNTPDSRLSNPIWRPLTQAFWEDSAVRGRAMVCRMSPFNCPVLGLDQPEGLKLPVYDNYFILEPSKPKDKKQATVMKYESLNNWLKWVGR